MAIKIYYFESKLLSNISLKVQFLKKNPPFHFLTYFRSTLFLQQKQIFVWEFKLIQCFAENQEKINFSHKNNQTYTFSTFSSRSTDTIGPTFLILSAIKSSLRFETNVDL